VVISCADRYTCGEGGARATSQAVVIHKWGVFAILSVEGTLATLESTDANSPRLSLSALRFGGHRHGQLRAGVCALRRGRSPLHRSRERRPGGATHKRLDSKAKGSRMIGSTGMATTDTHGACPRKCRAKKNAPQKIKKILFLAPDLSQSSN
jgi:hypothetical protein